METDEGWLLLLRVKEIEREKGMMTREKTEKEKRRAVMPHSRFSVQPNRKQMLAKWQSAWLILLAIALHMSAKDLAKQARVCLFVFMFIVDKSRLKTIYASPCELFQMRSCESVPSPSKVDKAK